MQFETQITEKDSRKRIDQFLAEATGQSRSAIQKQIDSGRVKVDGKACTKTGYRLTTGEKLHMPLAAAPRRGVLPNEMPLSILYEDEEMMVINKPAGIVVHPDTTGHQDNTIANAIVSHLKIKKPKDELRPGIVHRLDKDTSGALVIAKTAESLRKLSNLFQKRKVHKTYWALVKDYPKTTSGRISAPIKRDTKNRQQMAMHSQGKAAVTTFEIIENYGWCSLLKVNIETGRTHQIRLHLAGIGHPVLGDATYGNKALNARALKDLGLTRQWLHAKELDLDGKHFSAELPEDLTNTLTLLNG